MAITVIKRPEGYKLEDTYFIASSEDSSGDVLFVTYAPHGLSTGDHAYIDSDIETYNGFRYVEVISPTSFKVKESELGDYIPYRQDVTAYIYKSVLAHGWQNVHLPIVYKFRSDIFPNNTIDESYIPVVVGSFHDDNGNTRLDLNSPASDPVVLSKVELVGDGPLAGVYTITNVYNPSSITIGLTYRSTNDFSGYTIVKYYDNYTINVVIYSGLDPSHPWEYLKPYENAGTIRITPDENNEAIISISEYLRGYINTRNHLTLDSLPNNIDFMTSFYIEYYESYDISDGVDITTHTGPIETEVLGGNAVNSKNEFKNIYSGHLSEYISTDSYPGRWLTDFATPTAVVGYYFDLSFILIQGGTGFDVVINKKLNESVIDTETIVYPNIGIGVIRLPIVAESGYDEYCVTVYTTGGEQVTEEICIRIIDECDITFDGESRLTEGGGLRLIE